jgi:hypothetical protein
MLRDYWSNEKRSSFSIVGTSLQQAKDIGHRYVRARTGAIPGYRFNRLQGGAGLQELQGRGQTRPGKTKLQLHFLGPGEHASTNPGFAHLSRTGTAIVG